VVSSIYKATRSGGELYDWASGFLGGVCFGNPRRQINYRGEVGGTWSGAWDNPGSITGGHGSFPTTGNYARLTSCEPTKWIEFTAPNDIFAATGDSATGQYWTQGNDVLLQMLASQYTGQLVTAALAQAIGITTPMYAAISQAMTLGGHQNNFIDAAQQQYTIGGYGHTSYPFVPPESEPNPGPTSYQIALKWLTDKANAWATAPISLPATGIGWSTTLKPPA
jgi:hypothetical protein